MGEETQLSQDFVAAAARWLRAKGFDAVTVTGWDEDASAYAGCPTCGPETDIEVWVYYVTSAGDHKVYRHDGKFSYILTEILNA